VHSEADQSVSKFLTVVTNPIWCNAERQISQLVVTLQFAHRRFAGALDRGSLAPGVPHATERN